MPGKYQLKLPYSSTRAILLCGNFLWHIGYTRADIFRFAGKIKLQKLATEKTTYYIYAEFIHSPILLRKARISPFNIKKQPVTSVC